MIALSKNKLAFSKRRLAIIILLSVIGALLFHFLQPFKVTDPLDPRFDPSRLRIHDYKNDEELYTALTTAFPTATPRATVEAALVHKAFYRASREMPASDPGKAATYLVTLSDAWDEQNYYVDYTLWPVVYKHTTRGSKTVGVRVLYDRDSHTALEMYLLRFVQNKLGEQLQLRNPNSKAKIRQIELPPEWQSRKEGSRLP